VKTALIISALLLTACPSAAPPHSADKVPPAQQAPNTQGVEGHGGIAVVEPKTEPVAVVPTAFDAGACGGRTPKDLYLQAYATKETDVKRAAELFRQVVACTPADDKFHEKAAAYVQLLKQ
jgi:hypothetical protein